MNEKYYVKYHVNSFGSDSSLRYAGPYALYEAHDHQKDIAGFVGISDCEVITKIQFELDQTMNNQESS